MLSFLAQLILHLSQLIVSGILQQHQTVEFSVADTYCPEMSWESTAKMKVYEIHFLERGMNPVSRQICERRASPYGDRSKMVCTLGSDGEGW
jgi:hypothetical protein